MQIFGQLVVLILLVSAILVMLGAFAAITKKIRGANSWSQSYHKLSKRYGGFSKGFKKSAGTFAVGFGLKKPGLYFDYGRTFCRLRNCKRLQFSTNRSTEMLMNWGDGRLQLVVSTFPLQGHLLGGVSPLRQVFIDQPQFQSDFYVASNQPEVAKRMLNHHVQWQIEQLRRHTGKRELLIKIGKGKLLVAKPGYIKGHLHLEDFVRFSLNLFDQLMLIGARGIEFVNENQASIVSDVKCPICSEEIRQDMVVCTRCKTPHCRDCWHYYGQCATFACSETRYISTGEVRV